MHKLDVIIGSDDGVLAIQGHAITSTNAAILSIGPLGKIKVEWFSISELHLKILFAKWWPIGFSLNVLSWLWCQGILALHTFAINHRENRSHVNNLHFSVEMNAYLYCFLVSKF